ncbi:hypothetical protein [Tenacibaculum soleae]|uniref:hypothetical protein n=1 Tax=Tenacibaculum soleae TaxID=447689 RepID=UPI002300701E|nr:hypothetical protein [Tenacibaculum soleae]
MYKVFVNDKPIIFTTSIKNEEDYVVFIYKNTIIDRLIIRLKLGKLKINLPYKFKLDIMVS